MIKLHRNTMVKIQVGMIQVYLEAIAVSQRQKMTDIRKLNLQLKMVK